MEDPWGVAVVSSNLENRHYVAAMVSRLGIDPICMSSVGQYREIPGKRNVGLVFCDRQMKDGDYRDVLSMSLNAKVVMMSDLENPEEHQRARHLGLFDVISSPCRPTDIEWMVIQARRASRKELLRSSDELPMLHKTARAGA